MKYLRVWFLIILKLALLSSLLLFSGCAKREYESLWQHFSSPDNTFTLYRINTKGSAGWGAHRTYVYISPESVNDYNYPPNGYTYRLPNPHVRLFNHGVGCFDAEWVTETYVRIYYCLTKGDETGVHEFTLDNQTITVEFITSDLCDKQKLQEPGNISFNPNLKQCVLYFPDRYN